jgi:RNA polymerase sigma-70 factor (ECF subfamily)
VFQPVANNEDELISRAQAADTEAFCLLAKEYERRIYVLAFHYCHNPQDAEDLSQEVWLKAYQALGTFRGEASFYTWLRRIMINCFLNHQRSRRYSWRGEETEINSLALDSIADEHPGTAANSETSLHNKIMAARVMRALSELTPPQRLIFLLKHHEGMTYEEIAKAVGCSTGAAKKSVFRAVAKLREHLEIEVETGSAFNPLQRKMQIGV